MEHTNYYTLNAQKEHILITFTIHRAERKPMSDRLWTINGQIWSIQALAGKYFCSPSMISPSVFEKHQFSAEADINPYLAVYFIDYRLSKRGAKENKSPYLIINKL